MAKVLFPQIVVTKTRLTGGLLFSSTEKNVTLYTLVTNKVLKLAFAGGAGSVTGANFLLTGEDKSFLIDCGLSQGTKLADDKNWDPFPYDPKSVQTLFITHGHVDHIGRIPKLFYEGFEGAVYSTPATKDIAELMLEDTANILGHGDNENLQKIFSPQVLDKVFKNWKTLEYHTPHKDGNFSFRFLDAGHILGSAMLELIYNGKKIIFTGDLGNSPSPLLPDTEAIQNVDYLLMESVYGDRNHIDRNERRNRLESVIEDNFKRKGTLIIPTFSLERSQELLFEIDQLVENDRVPQVPIFFDSPLGIKLTRVYRKHSKYFNEFAQKIIGQGSDIFNFPGLKSTLLTEESKSILDVPDPKIVIAGSGMSNGGRILHHEANYLPNPNNTLLLTGYQSQGTLGRTIQDGAKTIRINGQDVPVRAKVVFIDGYSGHKDSDHLIEFVEQTADHLKKVYIAMGEPKAAMYLAQRLRDYLGVYAFAPSENDVVELDCN